MWERYCRGVQAIVYVVDAADHDGLDSGRQELHELLQKPSLARTPLLVLGNKNDLPGALSTTELIERLDLKVRQPVHERTHYLQVPSCCLPSAVYDADLLELHMHIRSRLSEDMTYAMTVTSVVGWPKP